MFLSTIMLENDLREQKSANGYFRCAYLNGNCTIIDVQTSIGRCYRIAPKNQTEAVITASVNKLAPNIFELSFSGSRSSFNVVLDLYSFGSKDTTTLV